MGDKMTGKNSKAGLATLAGGAIIVGSFLQFGLQAALPAIQFTIAEQELSNSNKSLQESGQQLADHVEKNKAFIATEPKLKHSGFWEPDEVAEMDSVSEFKTIAESRFGHQLYPLIPGYNDYIEELRIADSHHNNEGRLVMDRGWNHAEFVSTCDMVEQLQAGHELGETLESGGTVGQSPAGYTPHNFEALLQGCGDESLEYLDELESLSQMRLEEEAEMDKLFEELDEESFEEAIPEN